MSCLITFNGKSYTEEEFQKTLDNGLLYNLLDRGIVSLPINKEDLIISRKGFEANFVNSKEDFTSAMKTVFGLPQRQADAVANIYDRIATSWANLRSSTKDAYYKTINFFKSTPEQLKAIQPILYSQEQLVNIEKEKAIVKETTQKDGTYLKAPNGKNTQLTEDQWLTVQTPTFKKWFGNSQILDENNEPKIMYHGSHELWNVFDLNKSDENLGLFLTPEIMFAEDYTGIKDKYNVLELFVKSDKTFDYESSDDMVDLKQKSPDFYKIMISDVIDPNRDYVHSEESNWGIIERKGFQKFLRDNNYTGYYIKEQGIKNLSVYEPSGIKIADGRNQTFLENNPNILFQEQTSIPIVEKVIKGFELEREPKGFGMAFKSKTEKASPQLASAINSFILNTLGIDTVKFVYEKTYGTVNAVPVSSSSTLFQEAKAAILLGQDGNDIIYALSNPNVSSPLHELAHRWERELTDEQRQQVQDWAKTKDWTVATSEAFARGFEKYLADGSAPTKELQGLFDLFKKWLTDIYKGIVGSDINVTLNDPMKAIYAQMLGENYQAQAKEEVSKEVPIAQPKPKVTRIKTEVEETKEPEKWTKPVPEKALDKTKRKVEVKQALQAGAYDQAMSDGSMTKEQIESILVSAGLAKQNAQAIQFRIGNGSLQYTLRDLAQMNDKDAMFKFLAQYFLQNGNLEDAIKNNLISLDDAKTIVNGLKDKENISKIIEQKEAELPTVEETLQEEKEVVKEEYQIQQYEDDIQKEQVEEKTPTEEVAIPIVEKEAIGKYNKGDIVAFRGEPVAIDSVDEDGIYTLLDKDGFTKFAKADKLSEFNKEEYEKNKPVEKPLVNFKEDPNDNGIKYQDVPEYFSKEEKLQAAQKIDMLRNVTEQMRKFLPSIEAEIGFYNATWKGRIIDGKVQMNINTATLDTPIHEFMHPFVLALRVSNYDLYSNLITELTTGSNAYYVDLVNEDKQYASLTPQEREEEALVRYLGETISAVYKEDGTIDKDIYDNFVTSAIKDFFQWFQEILNKILGIGKSSAGRKSIGANSIDKITYNKETGKVFGYKEGSNNATFRIETDLVNNKQELLDRGFSNDVISKIKNLVDNSEDTVVHIDPKNLTTEDTSEEAFKGISVSDIPVNFTLKNISDFIVVHNQIKIDLSAEQLAINKMEAYQSVSQEQAKSIIKNITKKIEALKDISERRINGENILGTQIAAVKAILRDYDDIEAISEYVRQGMGGLDLSYNLLNDIKKQLALNEDLKPSEINNLNKQLVEVKSLLSFYDDVQKLYTYTIDDYEDFEINSFQRSIAKASSTKEQIGNVGADVVTEWLFPKYDQAQQIASDKTGKKDFLLTKDDFKKRLRFVDSDISMISYWMGSAITSRDPITAITSVIIKDALNENIHSESQTLFDISTEFNKFLQKNSIPNNIDNVTKYYQDNYLRKAKVWEVINISKDGEKKYGYVERWAFHEEKLNDLFDDDFRKFTESLAEPLTNEDRKDWNDKRFAWVKQNQNSDKYINKDFIKLKNDTYFNLLYSTYKSANNKYGERSLSYGIIPQAYKTEKLLEKAKRIPNDIKGYVKDVADSNGDLLSKAKKVTTDIGEKLFDSEAYQKAQDLNLDMSIYMGVKSPYTTLINPNDVDLRLNESVIGFNRAANTFSTLRDVQANADNLKMLIQGNFKLGVEARQVARVQKNGKLFFDRFLGRPSVKQEAKRVNEQLIQSINDIFYGVEEFESNLKLGSVNINLNKVGKNLGFYTALNNMSFNVFAGVSNSVIGNIMSLGESIGGKYYKPVNWKNAQVLYASQLGNFMGDVTNPIKSKITQLAIYYDAIQGEFRDKYGKNLTGGVIGKYAGADSLFFINHIAEHQIQLVGMLALMDATKVKTKSGETISLYDAFSKDNRGYYKLRSDINWSKEDNSNFVKRLHGISRDLNGNYAAFDKSVLQRYWIGKLALQYRKYMYSAWRSRFSSERFDPEREDFQAGFYRTFANKLYQDIATYRFNILKIAQSQLGKKDFTPEQKYAFNKTVYDASIMGACIFLATAIAGLEAPDDDKDKWIKNATLLTANRLFSDMSQFSFTAPQEFIKQAKSPSASLQTLSNMMDVIGQSFTDIRNLSFESYKQNTGSFQAGDSKLGAKFIKVVPGWRQFNRLARPEDQLKFYTLINKDISRPSN